MAKQIDDADVFTTTVDVLLANGYAGATTKLIAEAAGINEVTLFRKYGSKAQLVTAALLHERAALEGEKPTEYTGDLAADLLGMVRTYAEAAHRQSGLMMLILSEVARYPELQEAMQVPFMLVSRFGQIVAQYQKEGRLQPGEPLLVVGALLGPVIVNTMLRSAETGLPIPPIDLPVHIERFLHGYAIR
ncbi:MAG: TetR/AcrR family transcriptional regulator [Ardenticatenaceae bacterium]|nr:TetR/AcrR family transcriptional regulator [Ardenticatenaceae bacterium]